MVMTAPLVLSDSSDRSCFPPPLLFSGTGCVEKCRGSPSLQGIPRDATRLASDPPPGPGIGDGKVQGGAGPLPSRAEERRVGNECLTRSSAVGLLVNCLSLCVDDSL